MPDCEIGEGLMQRKTPDDALPHNEWHTWLF